jgi:hypothetical protein
MAVVTPSSIASVVSASSRAFRSHSIDRTPAIERHPIDPERETAMKTRHSALTLAVASSLALGASAAQAMNELGGGSTSAGAKSSSQRSAARLRSASAQLLQLMNQYKQQTINRSLRPDDRAGVHGVAP